MSEVQAAPPDAGGHLGALTRPDDVLMRPSEAQRGGASPPLHRMHSSTLHATRSVYPMAVIGLVLAGLVGVFILALIPTS